jgi:hypothetical protein
MLLWDKQLARLNVCSMLHGTRDLDSPFTLLPSVHLLPLKLA